MKQKTTSAQIQNEILSIMGSSVVLQKSKVQSTSQIMADDSLGSGVNQ